MTKLRTHRLFTFVPPPSRDRGNLEKLSLPAMVCIVVLFCAAAAIVSPAQSTLFRSLASFNGTNGSSPYFVTPVQGADGDIYGTTLTGGANYNLLCYSEGCGTVFKVTPLGALSTLYSFCAQPNCADGANPFAGLVQGSDGNFYGTAFFGGSYGYGTVLKITPSGSLTTLHSFCSQPSCSDGYSSFAPLLQASDGNFYGTTHSGGSYGYGTVFKITPSGSLTTLYSFCSQANCTDGANPYAGLVQGSDGNFYGTTQKGGYYCSPEGCGTVFRITTSGALTTLHSFNYTDGVYPYVGLVQARDGNFYGTTAGGGAFQEGTVFQITPTGTLTTLYSSCAQNVGGSCTDGQNPWAPLVQARDRNLYGTTFSGGIGGFGTIFEITPSGTLTTLHGFDFPDGSGPHGLVQATSGVFYGTTFAGGIGYAGTVFSLLVIRECATCLPSGGDEPAGGRVGSRAPVKGRRR